MLKAGIRFIQWNIGYSASMEKIVNLIGAQLTDNCIVAIEEVTPNHFKELVEITREYSVKIFYSLEYRPAGKFDTNARKLGIVFLVSGDFEDISVGVYDRALLPERTLILKAKFHEEHITVVAFHSITGCNHLMAKSHQFCTFAECIDEVVPDVVMIDANEPEKDHYDITKMHFFERNGKGAEVFFKMLSESRLVDSYSVNYNVDRYKEGDVLATSHIISGNNRQCRYDFVFINKDRFIVEESQYLYEAAVEATADHAMVIVDAN